MAVASLAVRAALRARSSSAFEAGAKAGRWGALHPWATDQMLRDAGVDPGSLPRRGP